jgi:NADPH:quinone reductase-like Zn-dependent oxidoreductase
MGVRTLCFLRNPCRASELIALGAAAVFEDSSGGFEQAIEALGMNRAQLAFNTVGGDSALRLMKLLGNGSTHITYGAMARKPLTIPNGSLIFKDIHFRGLWVSRWMEESLRDEIEATYAGLCEMILARKLLQDVDSIFELANFRDALLRLDAADRHGKVLFSIT